jgi:hypothetical protein
MPHGDSLITHSEAETLARVGRPIATKQFIVFATIGI